MDVSLKFEEIKKLLSINSVEKAQKIVQEVYNTALKDDNQEALAKALYYFGLINNKLGDFEKAINYYTRSKKIYENFNDLHKIMDIYNEMANIFTCLGKFKNAAYYYMQILNIMNDKKIHFNGKANILNNLANMFTDINEFELAEKYLNECIDIALKSKEELILAVAYYNLAKIFYKKDDYQQSSIYLQNSKLISEKIEDKIGLSFCLGLEASILNGLNNSWDKVNNMFELALADMKKVGFDHDIIELLVLFGEQAYKVGHFEESRKLLEQSLDISNKHKYFIKERQALEILSKVYEKENDIPLAYNCLKRIFEINSFINKQTEIYDINNSLFFSIKKETDEIKIKELRDSVKTMKVLAEIGKALTQSENMDQIFEILSKEVYNLLNLDAFGIGILKDQDDILTYLICDEHGLRKEDVSFSSKDYLMAVCISEKQEIIITDVSTRDYRDKYSEAITRVLNSRKEGSVIFCPMIYDGKVIGGITGQSNKSYAFSYTDMDTLRLLADYISISIINHQKTEELKIKNKEFEDLAKIDALTSVYNRHEMLRQMENLNNFENNNPLCAMMIDIDYFKQYNDNYGHLMGDNCLRQISKVLRDSLMEEESHIFRYGGDEFFTVIYNCDYDKCTSIINKMFDKVNKLSIKHIYSDISDHISITVGAVILEKNIDDFEQIIQASDIALYKAKNNGRKTFVIDELD